MRPNSETNRKKKRRYHKGRSRKRNCHTDSVVNLSNYQLSENEIKVLAKRLKFIPSPRNIYKTEVLADIKKFGRRAVTYETERILP